MIEILYMNLEIVWLIMKQKNDFILYLYSFLLCPDCGTTTLYMYSYINIDT